MLRFLKFASIILFLSPIFLDIACNEKKINSKPNILLISIDSLRRDHLSCYGYFRNTTPNIDKLASKGTIFDDAVSTTCWTLPTHMSMFTGLYLMQHGVRDNGLVLSRSIKTIPEFLHEDGYQTFGIFSGPYLHPAYGFSRGFDEYKDCSSSSVYADKGDKLNELNPYLQKIHNQSHKDITGDKILKTFADWFADKSDEKPFFSFIHMWDVHYDFIPPPPYDKEFDPNYQGNISIESYRENPEINKNMCTRDLEHVIALYDGEIKWTDHIIGEILKILEKSGYLNNTMVIITSDHGEEFFEHGDKCHRNLYDVNIRIPLIIYYPELFSRRNENNHANQIDLLPTILDVTGNDIPDYLPGIPLNRIQDLNNPKNRSHLLEYITPQTDVKAVRAADWKFIYEINKNLPLFYNLISDPAEKHSLIPLEDPIRISDSVRDRINYSFRFYKRIYESLPEIQTSETEKLELDKATEEHLKSLGYIQ